MWVQGRLGGWDAGTRSASAAGSGFLAHTPTRSFATWVYQGFPFSFFVLIWKITIFFKIYQIVKLFKRLSAFPRVSLLCWTSLMAPSVHNVLRAPFTANADHTHVRTWHSHLDSESWGRRLQPVASPWLSIFVHTALAFTGGSSTE